MPSECSRPRIGHVHCKDVIRQADAFEWAALGQGFIDFVGQFRALKQVGHHNAVTLETHGRGAGTPEASSRKCWEAMTAQLRQAGTL